MYNILPLKSMLIHCKAYSHIDVIHLNFHVKDYKIDQ